MLLASCLRLKPRMFSKVLFLNLKTKKQNDKSIIYPGEKQKW